MNTPQTTVAYDQGHAHGFEYGTYNNPYHINNQSEHYKEWVKGYHDGYAARTMKYVKTVRMTKENTSIKADFVYNLCSLLMTEIRRLEEINVELNINIKNLSNDNAVLMKTIDEEKTKNSQLTEEFIKVAKDLHDLKTPKMYSGMAWIRPRCI